MELIPLSLKRIVTPTLLCSATVILLTSGALAQGLTAPVDPLPPDAPGPAAAAVPRTSAPARPPSTSQMATARLHFQQGVALYEERNYDAALAEFEGAYSASKEPVVLYNLGLTYKALFRYAESVDALERYLRESAARQQDIPPERRAEVEGLVTEMKSLLADTTLIVLPPDADLRIDGRSVTLGIEGIVKLAAGTHTIKASASDYVSLQRDVTVVAGVPQTVSLKLAAIPRTGHLKVGVSQPGARVAIDGRAIGAPPVEVELGAGGHNLEVSAPGFASSSTELVVAAGQSRSLLITLEPPPPPLDTVVPFYHRWWFWTGIGLVAAAAGTYALWPRTQPPINASLGTPTNAD